MAQEQYQLPKGWELPVPDELWPETLLAAVRHDVMTLACSRVINTIRAWREQAGEGVTFEQRDRAKARLHQLGSVLSGDDGMQTEQFRSLPRSEDHTVDAIDVPEIQAQEKAARELQLDETLPPPPSRVRNQSRLSTPKRRPASPLVKATLEPRSISSGAILKARKEIARLKKPETGSSLPPTDGFGEEDDKPTTALPYPGSTPKPDPRGPSNVSDARPPPSLPPPMPVEIGRDFDEEDGGPTRHIDIPDEVLERRVASVAEGLGIPMPTGLSDRPDSKEIERRVASVAKGLGIPEPSGLKERPASEARQKLELPGPSKVESTPADNDEPETAYNYQRPPSLAGGQSPRLPPKPGVIRRSSRAPRRATSAPKPRAAAHHVRSMYPFLIEFATELVPLAYERRSRRFWARWREVVGDRGVRREVIEDILRNARDERGLVCALIAEAHSVDVRSVHALVDKMLKTGELAKNTTSRGAAARDHSLRPGSAVQVQGIPLDEE